MVHPVRWFSAQPHRMLGHQHADLLKMNQRRRAGHLHFVKATQVTAAQQAVGAAGLVQQPRFWVRTLRTMEGDATARQWRSPDA